MSGPTTAVYEAMGTATGIAGLSAVILAARAIKEARDMHAEYGEAHNRVCGREKERSQQRHQLQEANSQRISNLNRHADRLEAKLSRMLNLLQGTASDELIRPATQDDSLWNDYLGKLEAAIKNAEELLPVVEEISEQDLEVYLSEMPDTNRLLAAYAQQHTMQSRLTADESAHYKELSLHLISKLELAVGEALPIRIEHLAREMLCAHDVVRAEALAMNMRLEIQRTIQQRRQQQADTKEMILLLSQFGDALPDEVRIELEAVAAGVRMLDEKTRAIVTAALEEIRKARLEEEQEAISMVLEQSLRDLGYEVDDISQTLFVSGGLVHFQKQSWHNYYVRMRVNPADKTVNFNVVRAQSSGDAVQDKRLDYLAEDRWCSEVPVLLKTLEARGMKLSITRLLQAGEVPVQVVNAATLPAVRTEEQRHQTVAAKQMKL